MAQELAPCLRCGEAVPNASTGCPRCGYDLDRHERRRRWLGALGTLSCLSVVLAPLGVPLLWLAYRHRLAAEGTVTRRPESAVGHHLRTAIGHHLGLAPNDSRGRTPIRAPRDGVDTSQR